MIAAKMTFGPLNLEIRSASLAGVLFLACVSTSRAEDLHLGSSQIWQSESSTTDTNTPQIQTEDSPASRLFMPRAPHTFQMPNRLPAPQPQTQITIQTDREKELLDRRRNWVFMTPEEMMGTDPQKDDLPGDKYEKDGQEKKSVTVMERYYQNLYDTDQQKATNQLNKFDPDTWTKANNSLLTGDSQQSGNTTSPSSDMGVFQSTRGNAFENVFGTAKSDTASTPEEVRLKAEQDAHMESFKQLWEIDQQPTRAPVAATATPVIQPSSSTSVFGSQQPIQPFIQVSEPAKNTGLGQAAPPAPAPTITSLREHSSPPRASFAPVSSPF